MVLLRVAIAVSTSVYGPSGSVLGTFREAVGMWICYELVQEGTISPDQMVDAMRQQAEYRLPIGQLAVEAGFMTTGQVFDALAVQYDKDLPLGEIAIELGYLDRSQLAELILRQIEDVPSMTEILVQAGALSNADLRDAVARHRRTKGFRPEHQVELRAEA